MDDNKKTILAASKTVVMDAPVHFESEFAQAAVAPAYQDLNDDLGKTRMNVQAEDVLGEECLDDCKRTSVFNKVKGTGAGKRRKKKPSFVGSVKTRMVWLAEDVRKRMPRPPPPLAAPPLPLPPSVEVAGTTALTEAQKRPKTDTAFGTERRSQIRTACIGAVAILGIVLMASVVSAEKESNAENPKEENVSQEASAQKVKAEPPKATPKKAKLKATPQPVGRIASPEVETAAPAKADLLSTGDKELETLALAAQLVIAGRYKDALVSYTSLAAGPWSTPGIEAMQIVLRQKVGNDE